MILKCLIIDDNAVSVEGLMSYISNASDLELIGYESNPLIALKKIMDGAISADIIFLDVQMPQMDGAELAKEILGTAYIIFTSAYPEGTFRALDVVALDYLRKPFSYLRFCQSIQKVKEKILLRTLMVSPANEWKLPIKGPRKGIYDFIDPGTIIYIQSYSNYVKIFTEDNKMHIAYLSLKEMKFRVLGLGFIQIHKTYIINLRKIKRLSGKEIEMNDGTKLDIGEKFYNDFIQQLNDSTSL